MLKSLYISKIDKISILALVLVIATIVVLL